MALTKRQRQVLDFIASFLEENGYSPSYEEIAAALGLGSVATVHKHVQALERRGYLKRSFNRSRSLIPVQPHEQIAANQQIPTHQAGSFVIPLVGRIAAGLPVEAFPDARELDLAAFVKSDRTFALEVRGDSMIEDHICSGDIVLVEKTTEVRDGDIVVALVKGSEATLKRFYREPGGKVRLQPANSAMQPVIVPAADVEIQGRVLAVLRKYR